MAIAQEASLLGTWTRFFKKYWLRLAIVCVVVLAAVLAAAIRAGMSRSADAKASALFAQAKTIEDYQAILAQVPESYLTFDILFSIANLQHQQGDSAKAREYYQKAYDAHPTGFQGAAAQKALGLVNK